MAAGANQLFQVLYLGSTVADRHCSHSVMPWIAEELKLRTERRILAWVTTGERGACWEEERERERRERERREGGGICTHYIPHPLFDSTPTVKRSTEQD